MTCKVCGEELEEKMNYCPSCGEPLKKKKEITIHLPPEDKNVDIVLVWDLKKTEE